LSGSDPQIRKAAERYLLTIFAMGCNLGPTQAARHLDSDVTAHMLSFVNRPYGCSTNRRNHATMQTYQRTRTKYSRKALRP
jgi:hypothetical protein